MFSVEEDDFERTTFLIKEYRDYEDEFEGDLFDYLESKGVWVGSDPIEEYWIECNWELRSE